MNTPRPVVSVPRPRVLDADQSVRARNGLLVEQFDLPHPVAAVAPALLQDDSTAFTKPGRETSRELFGRAVEIDVGAPADVPGAEQHFLGSQLQNHAGIRGDPDALRRGLEKHSVQVPSVGAVLNRIDPDQDTVEREQLVPNLVDRAVLEHHRAEVHRQPAERLVQRCEAVAFLRL